MDLPWLSSKVTFLLDRRICQSPKAIIQNGWDRLQENMFRSREDAHLYTAVDDPAYYAPPAIYY